MKFTAIIDAFVIGFLCLAVAFGTCGCSSPPTQIFEEGIIDEPDANDDASGWDRDATPESREDVQKPEAPADAGEPDSGRESGGADSGVGVETWASPDAPADVLPPFEHRLATGELYRSDQPSGDPSKPESWTPGLFAEQISEVERHHPGDWRPAYDARCDLSSEGHGLENCKVITMTGMSVMLCPYGVSFVRATASCPPLKAPVSWW